MFPYYGDIPELSSVLDSHRDCMYQAYKDVLGSLLIRPVEEADKILLDENSFHGSEFFERFGVNPTSRKNKFFTAFGEDSEWAGLNTDGSFSPFKTQVAPGFILTREGFDISREYYSGWVNPYLAPYIHEYNHFLIFALQEKPMMVAISILVSKIKPKSWPPKIGDIESLIGEYEGTREEKQLVALLTVWGMLIHGTYESFTRILDGRVMQRMGFDVPGEYFNIPPKQFLPLFMESIQTVIAVPVGDMLYGASIRERMRTLQDWVARMDPSNEVQSNFMECFREMEIEKVPMSALPLPEQGE